MLVKSQKKIHLFFKFFELDFQVCIPTAWICDAYTDCSDGWDEGNTTASKTLSSMPLIYISC